MRNVGLLLWKDALEERRSFERIGTLGLFAAAVLVTLNFALPPTSDARRIAAAGFLWAAVVFASVLEFRRTFEVERRDGTLDGLRASPLDPTALYVAKVLSTLVVVGVLGVALVVLTELLFVGRFTNTAEAAGVVVLGALGLIAWGTLFSLITTGSRSGDLVLPVLLFPLVVPQTIACVRLLATLFGGEPLADMGTGLILLGAFDVLSLGTGLLLFEYVLDE